MFQATYDSNGNDSSTVADTNQQVWDFSIGGLFNIKGASTGGYSKIFAKPTWQTGVPGIAGKFRAVPDLVLGGGNLGGKEILKVINGKIKIIGNVFAAPGFWECFDAGLAAGFTPTGPQWSTTGGTSIVPPLYAGILAIIAQKTGASQGLINSKLYAMAMANRKTPSAVGLIDIVKGNNAFSAA